MKNADKRFYSNIGITFNPLNERIKAGLYEKLQDFKVMEGHKGDYVCPLTDINAYFPGNIKTPFISAVLLKKGISTFEAVDLFAEKNCLDPHKDISYCGLKDTDGITSQKICIKNKNITHTKFNQFLIGNFKPSMSALQINSHSGNYFMITARRYCQNRKNAAILRRFSKLAAKGLPNYYGAQRFGIRQDNHLLGKLLLKRRYNSFLYNFLTYSRNESGKIQNIREKLRQNYGDWKKCLSLVIREKGLHYEKKLLGDLSEGKDLLYSVKNMRISQFFIHSYSSYIFNQVLSNHLSRKYANVKLVKLGKGTRLNKMTARLYAPVLEKENIAVQDFEKCDFEIESHDRQALFYPRNFSYSTKNGSLILSFGMGNGEYASLLLEFLIDSKKRKLC